MKTLILKDLIKFCSEKAQAIPIFELSQLKMKMHCFEPGQSQKSVQCENDAIYVILEGKARVTVGRATREFGPGTCIPVKADTECGIINIGDHKMVLISASGVSEK